MLLLCAIAYRSYGFGDYTTVTLKVGESYSLYASNFNTAQTHLISGEAIVVSYTSNSPSSFKIYAVKSGIAFFSYYDKCVLFNVVDVIPNRKDIIIGEEFKFSPNIDSGVKLTWSSNNPSVATITSDGVVTGVSSGVASISCINTDGIAFSCLVSVGTQLVSSISLNYHSFQLNMNENLQLEPTLLPNNATNTQVKWLSTNENIAQVDDEGNVTAIAPGYCSIYAMADDGSGKYDKCLINVKGTTALKGDINGDGHVNLSDASWIVRKFVGKEN